MLSGHFPLDVYSFWSAESFCFVLGIVHCLPLSAESVLLAQNRLKSLESMQMKTAEHPHPRPRAVSKQRDKGLVILLMGSSGSGNPTPQCGIKRSHY